MSRMRIISCNGQRPHGTARGRRRYLGVDQVELSLEGRSKGAMASCTGMAKQAPNLSFKATLILAQDDVPRVGRNIIEQPSRLTRGGYRSRGCVNTSFNICIKVSAYRLCNVFVQDACLRPLFQRVNPGLARSGSGGIAQLPMLFGSFIAVDVHHSECSGLTPGR